MFVWVNSHGSFPLGIVALALLWAGRRLDGGDGRVEWRCLKWAIVGTAVAALNPYGPKLLLFPISMLQRSDVLRTILEWQAPTYDTIWQKLFLVQIAVAVVVLVRRPTLASRPAVRRVRPCVALQRPQHLGRRASSSLPRWRPASPAWAT